jgi:hypothetical protein
MASGLCCRTPCSFLVLKCIYYLAGACTHSLAVLLPSWGIAQGSLCSEKGDRYLSFFRGRHSWEPIAPLPGSVQGTNSKMDGNARKHVWLFDTQHCPQCTDAHSKRHFRQPLHPPPSPLAHSGTVSACFTTTRTHTPIFVLVMCTT